MHSTTYESKEKERVKERPAEPPKQEILQFKHNNSLLISRGKVQDTVQVLHPSGEVQITIKMTEQGAVISLSGNTIEIEAKEKFIVQSPVIDLKASEEIKLTSEGDLHTNVKRDSFNTARIQHITADLGNVNIKANDDVRLDGERVKLNCTD